jgi:hypothetical protein
MNNYSDEPLVKRISISPFFTNIKIACAEAERVFQPFIPNGLPNPFLNYKLEISPGVPSGKYHNIVININPIGRTKITNEIISLTATVTKNQSGKLMGSSEGYISALQVGDWVTGDKPDFLKGKRIGYFLMLIYLYIARKLDLFKIDLEDMSQIPNYYEFMGFISYDPNFSPEEKTIYYKGDIGWKQDVRKVLDALEDKNTEDNDIWNWREGVNRQELLNVTILHLPSSRGMGRGRKRRSKRPGTKKKRPGTKKSKY